jgi:hypothetical protein
LKHRSKYNALCLYSQINKSSRQKLCWTCPAGSQISFGKTLLSAGGYTTNIKRRFAEHNDSQSFHTSKYAPWKLEMYFVFSTETKALKFEKYLKSGSGRAFAQMHFM